MSGLFETLIEAARGTAPVILHRPSSNFPSLEFGEEPWEPVIDEVPASLPHAVADDRPSIARADRGVETRPPPPIASAEPAEIRAPQRPDRRTTRSVEEAEMVDTPRPRSSPLQGEPKPELRASEAPPATEPAIERIGPVEILVPPTREADLLLPEMALPPPAASSPDDAISAAPHFRPEPPAREDARQSAPSIELRIGRIEVVAPRTQAAAQPQSRPVSVARARPRQSLDDYLARRRH
ncbi:MAG: hypothetical protein ACJ8ER_04280 [Allosphingosinicella sp.]